MAALNEDEAARLTLAPTELRHITTDLFLDPTATAASNGQAQQVAEWRDSNHDDLRHGLGGGSDEILRKGRTAAL